MPTASDVLRELLLAAPKVAHGTAGGAVEWPDPPGQLRAPELRYNRALTAACDWLIRNP